jgi:hypothetical protein
LLEKDEYYVNIENITGEGFGFNGTYNGLELPQNILDEIYYENPIRFLTGKPGIGNSSKVDLKLRGSGNDHDSSIVSHFQLNLVLGTQFVLISVSTRRIKHGKDDQ